MNIYAVVCNGSAIGFQEALTEYDPPASCLYNEPIDPNTFRNAPFLIEVTEAIKPWLAAQETPWGLYLMTNKEVSFNALRQHLRRYTYAKIPSQEVPVLFRFYDPRIFWEFSEVIDDWNLHAMLGPIEIVASNFGELKQDHFEARRKNYPLGAKMRGMFLTLTQKQEIAINSVYQQRFEQNLYDYMLARMDINDYLSDEDGLTVHVEMLYQEFAMGKEITNPADIKMLREYQESKAYQIELSYEEKVLLLTRAINQYCIDQEILDGKLIKGIALLFIRDKVIDFQNMKPEWHQALKKNANSGTHRAKKLLLKELGTLKHI